MKNNYHDSIKAFIIPKRLIKVTIFTNEYHALIFHGEGGIGKTILTLNEVKKHCKKNEYIYFNGYTTPLSLFNILDSAKEKRLVILDDIEGLFNNSIAISILKSALWTNEEQRIIEYHSTRNNSPSFTFNAQLIILCNKIPKKDLNIQALFSRALCYELILSYKQKMTIIKELINERKDLDYKQKLKCVSILETETNEATKDLNLRLLNKLIAFIKEDNNNSLDLFRATTKKDEEKETLIKIIKEEKVIEEQIRKFISMTGKSRRTFFRIKKQLKEE